MPQWTAWGRNKFQIKEEYTKSFSLKLMNHFLRHHSIKCLDTCRIKSASVIYNPINMFSQGWAS